jgi:hypothetical protein
VSRLWEWLAWAWDLLFGVLRWVGDAAFEFAKDRPLETGVLVLGFVRLFGTTIRTGNRGVLFTFGRARRVLEPGFHPLIPLIQAVRTTPVRSVTLDLPKQRALCADGLAYDVQANLVYHVEDPITAFVEIDDVRKGILTALALVVQDLIRTRTHAELHARVGLDEEFGARAGDRLKRWGVVVEQAGFKSLAPSKASLRLSQLARKAEERQRVLAGLIGEGLTPGLALGLLGSERQLIGHARDRYHSGRRTARLRKERRERLQKAKAPPAPAKPVIDLGQAEANVGTPPATEAIPPKPPSAG